MKVLFSRFLVIFIIGSGLLIAALLLIFFTPPWDEQRENSAPLLVCPNQLSVTNPSDDINTCNTLRNALDSVKNNTIANPVTININLNPGTEIKTSGSGYVVAPGVSITGVCTGLTGPAISINGSGVTGDGFTLGAGSTLFGLQITGFTGRQIKVSNSGNQASNILDCVKTGNSLVPDLNITLNPKSGSLSVNSSTVLTYTLASLDLTQRISGFTIDVSTSGPLNLVSNASSMVPVEPNPGSPIFTQVNRQISANHATATYVVILPAAQLPQTVTFTVVVSPSAAGSGTLTLSPLNTRVVGPIPGILYDFLNLDTGSFTLT